MKYQNMDKNLTMLGIKSTQTMETLKNNVFNSIGQKSLDLIIITRLLD